MQLLYFQRLQATVEYLINTTYNHYCDRKCEILCSIMPRAGLCKRIPGPARRIPIQLYQFRNCVNPWRSFSIFFVNRTPPSTTRAHNAVQIRMYNEESFDSYLLVLSLYDQNNDGLLQFNEFERILVEDKKLKKENTHIRCWGGHFRN